MIAATSTRSKSEISQESSNVEATPSAPMPSSNSGNNFTTPQNICTIHLKQGTTTRDFSIANMSDITNFMTILHPNTDYFMTNRGKTSDNRHYCVQKVTKSSISKAYASESSDIFVFSETVSELPDLSYKGGAGSIAIFGGCDFYTGAPVFAGLAGLYAGADYVRVFTTTKQAADCVRTVAPDLVASAHTQDEPCSLLSGPRPIRCDCVCVGCGLGRDEKGLFLLGQAIGLAERCECPLVVDGDALVLVAEQEDYLHRIHNMKGPVVFTPNHPEMCTLAGVSMRDGTTMIGTPAMRAEQVQAEEEVLLGIEREDDTRTNEEYSTPYDTEKTKKGTPSSSKKMTSPDMTSVLSGLKAASSKSSEKVVKGEGEHQPQHDSSKVTNKLHRSSSSVFAPAPIPFYSTEGRHCLRMDLESPAIISIPPVLSAFAERNHTYLLLKGPRDVIVSPNGVGRGCRLKCGARKRVSGQGDVLVGVLGAFFAKMNKQNPVSLVKPNRIVALLELASSVVRAACVLSPRVKSQAFTARDIVESLRDNIVLDWKFLATFPGMNDLWSDTAMILFAVSWD